MLLKRFSQTFKICLALMLSVLSTGILQTVPVYADPPVNNGQETCPNDTFTTETGGWDKTDGLSSTTFEVPQKAGFTVTQLCYKASDEVEYPAVSSTITSTVTNRNGQVQNLSHVSVYYTPTVTTTVIALPAAPSVNDLCDVGNATWVLPADTATLDWSLTAGELSVSIIPANTTFPGGATSHNFGLAVETNVTPCPPEVTTISVPVAPSIADLCGVGNATWNLPEDTATLDWSLTAGVLSVSIIPANTVFEGTGLTTHSFGTATETNVTPCPVDVCPNIRGIQETVPADRELIDGKCERKKITICHRTNAVKNPYRQITVSVNAVDGVEGNSGNRADHFDEHDGPIFDPAIHDNGDDWGDIIPPVPPHHEGLNWTTEGRAIYDNDCKVPKEEPPVLVADIDFAIVCVPNGVKVTLVNSGTASGTATVNGTVHTVAAGATKEVVLGFDLGTPFMTAVTVTVDGNTSTQTVNCAPGQGGQVLGDTTGKTLSAATALPETLPATGGMDNPFLIIIASLVAYGATYFLQGRRRVAQNINLSA